MNDSRIAQKVVEALDQSSQQIKQGTLYRLQSARQQALARFNEQQNAGFSWVNPFSAVLHRGKLGFGLGISAVVLIIGMVMTVNNSPSEPQLDGEIDAKLLADDLPIDAYLDNSFKVWIEDSTT